MTLKNIHKIKNLVIAIAVTLFFSCNSNLKEVQKIGVLQNEPIGIAENINLKYTEKLSDTGRVIANLISPKMLDYSNRDFAYSEFPDGIHLIVFDEEDNKSVIVSDYAIYYGETDVIDLQGNVVLSTHNKDTLYAEQLYYDQRREWLFTNQPVTLKFGRNRQNGNGFDSDSNFKTFEIMEGSGLVFLDE